MAENAFPVAENIKTTITQMPRKSQPAKLFDVTRAYDEIALITSKKLRNKSYESEEASKLCKDLADEIRAKVRIISANRYKICVQANIFSQKGQGIVFKERQFWDTETDFTVQYTHQNDEFVCIVMCYGVYYY